MALDLTKLKERLDEYHRRYEEWAKAHPKEAAEQKAEEERERQLDQYWEEWWMDYLEHEHEFDGI